jgi:hypothetical protein
VFDDLGSAQGDPVQKPEAGDMRAVYGNRHVSFLDKVEDELAHLGFAHFGGRAHEMLAEVPDTSHVSAGRVGAVPFEQKIGLHLFLKFSHGFPPYERF